MGSYYSPRDMSVLKPLRSYSGFCILENMQLHFREIARCDLTATFIRFNKKTSIIKTKQNTSPCIEDTCILACQPFFPFWTASQSETSLSLHSFNGTVNHGTLSFLSQAVSWDLSLANHTSCPGVQIQSVEAQGWNGVGEDSYQWYSVRYILLRAFLKSICPAFQFSLCSVISFNNNNNNSCCYCY